MFYFVFSGFVKTLLPYKSASRFRYAIRAEDMLVRHLGTRFVQARIGCARFLRLHVRARTVRTKGEPSTCAPKVLHVRARTLLPHKSFRTNRSPKVLHVRARDLFPSPSSPKGTC